MLEDMTIEQLHEVSTTLQKRMSITAMRNAAKTFSQDKGVSLYEAIAILFVAYAIKSGESIDDVIKTKERRLRELCRLEKSNLPAPAAGVHLTSPIHRAEGHGGTAMLGNI